MTVLGKPLSRVVAIAVVVVLAATAVIWYVFAASTGKHVTAYFTGAIGVYPGSDVRVLGVKVGTIDEVQPEGKQVKVQMTVDRGVKVPEGASALVFAPSIVADRYVQLTPVYHDGPEMADNTSIPVERTATPVELDQLAKSVDEVAKALGPNGANKNGELADLLNTVAANVKGNGSAMNTTLKDLSKAAKTLDGSRKDAFGTVDNLQKFTGMLAANDSQVRQFAQLSQDVTKFLASEREDLGTALKELATALQMVNTLVKENHDSLKSNVDKLAAISQVLVNQRAALAEFLDNAPVALNNGVNAYDARTATLQSRIALNELNNPPILMLCKLLQNGAAGNDKIPDNVVESCKHLSKVIDGTLPLPSVAQLLEGLQKGQPPALPLPLVDVMKPAIEAGDK
ncbi:MCE family protein [Pseudonocardiaceae bacterium YIM PH 21723]|nr:MCE family protein [Pseudonocardiaceae bacterium YIM PH 21723]